MPDYAPGEMRQREFYEAQKEERRKSLAASLRNKHIKYARSIPLEELSVRIDATRHVLDTIEVSYRKINTRSLSDSRRRSYLVQLLTAIELNARARSVD